MISKVEVDQEKLAAFCSRWKIVRLDVFGSALREDFRADSDLDILVEFAPEARWSLFEEMAMQEELEELTGRQVDLVRRRAVEQSRNRVRREAILSSAKPLYAAR